MVTIKRARGRQPVYSLEWYLGLVLAVAEGLTNAEVAADLGISEDSVRYHTRIARARVNARTNAQLVAQYYHWGWLKPRVTFGEKI